MRALPHRLVPFPLGPLFLLVAIFFLNFTCRIILAPLLPIITRDLSLGYGGAGSLFFLIQVGYSVGLLVSGVLSARLTHRHTILLSTTALGGVLLVVALSTSASALRMELVCLGVVAGLYLPSSIATITGFVDQAHWGKAIAIHELAPNLGFIAAPFLAEGLLQAVAWRSVLGILGGLALAMGGLFAWRGQGGRHRGEAPRLSTLRPLLADPSVWTASLLFSVAIGSGLGLYTMMPLYLVSEVGLDREVANTVTGSSRVPGIALIFLAGAFADRIGYRRSLAISLTATGALTVLLGAAQGRVLTPILLLLQAAASVCFFPVAYSLLSTMFPLAQRGLAVSLVTIVGGLFGSGVLPSALGYIAEVSSFRVGITLMGLLTLAMALLLRRPSPAPKI